MFGCLIWVFLCKIAFLWVVAALIGWPGAVPLLRGDISQHRIYDNDLSLKKKIGRVKEHKRVNKQNKDYKSERTIDNKSIGMRKNCGTRNQKQMIEYNKKQS